MLNVFLSYLINVSRYKLTRLGLRSKNLHSKAVNAISSFSSCILNLLASQFVSDFSDLFNSTVLHNIMRARIFLFQDLFKPEADLGEDL